MTRKFPPPFEFLNDATEEYIRWFVWAFEKKYGKGSWERTLAEKWKEVDDDSNGEPSNGRRKRNGGDGNEWR